MNSIPYALKAYEQLVFCFKLFMKSKHTILLIAFFCFFLMSKISFAQVGIQTSLYNTSELFSLLSYEYQIKAKHNKQIGLFCVYKIQKKRIEIIPEISFSMEDNFQVRNDTFQFRYLNTRVNLNFYPLNFNTDWHVSDNSKKKNFIEKGLFINANAGVRSWSWFSNNETFEEITSISNFSIGFGIGLDIELSKFLLLTPFYKTNIRRTRILGKTNRLLINRHFGLRLGYNFSYY